MSRLFMIGLSHLTAPVAVRERLTIPRESFRQLLPALREAAGLREAAVLSTCSRFEVYGEAEDPAAPGRVTEWLVSRAGEAVRPHLQVLRGQEAIRRAARVAAGLESWIVGETEILGQVKAATQEAQGAGTAGRNLNIVLQRALACGKAVRTKTRIAEGIRSIGGAAAMLAKKVFGENGARSVLLFGAGTMAKAAVQHLNAKGVRSVRVANRTFERAAALAEGLGGIPMGWDDGMRSLADADVVIFSTSAREYVIGPDALRAAARARGGRSLFLIDVGVPRNVDPRAADIEGVYLYDVDDLKRMIERSRSSQDEAVRQAETMVEETVADCWRRLSRPVPAGGER